MASLFSVQLDSGHFQEQTQEYARWKELRDRLAADLRLSVSLLHDDVPENKY